MMNLGVFRAEEEEEVKQTWTTDADTQPLFFCAHGRHH